MLFANAGVAYATPLAATPEARFDEIMAINVKSVFFTMVHFATLLRGGASVVLNTSWLGDVGTAGLSVMSASKAAVRSLARTWSAELAPRNIRVNAVSPGAIATPIHGKTGMSPDELHQFATALQPKFPWVGSGKQRRWRPPSSFSRATSPDTCWAPRSRWTEGSRSFEARVERDARWSLAKPALRAPEEDDEENNDDEDDATPSHPARS